MARTQPYVYGPFSGRRYGAFSGKAAVSGGPHPAVKIVQAYAAGVLPGRRYGSFAGRSAALASVWDFAAALPFGISGTLFVTLPSGFEFFVATDPPGPLPTDIYTVRRVELARKISSTPMQVAIDFLSVLPDGVSLLSCEVTASVFSGTDASPSSLIQGAATTQRSVVTQGLVVGQPGVIYQLLFSAIGSDGQAYQLLGLLPVLSA